MSEHIHSTADGLAALGQAGFHGLLGEAGKRHRDFASADYVRFNSNPAPDKDTVYFFERPVKNFDKNKVYVYRFDDPLIADFHPAAGRAKEEVIRVEHLFHDDSPSELELLLESVSWDVISHVFGEPRHGDMISMPLAEAGGQHTHFFNPTMLEHAICQALEEAPAAGQNTVMQN